MALSPAATLEAVLFASGEPITKKRLGALLGVSGDLLEAGLGELAKNLHGRGLALIDTGEEVELRTAPGAADIVKKLREAELSRDLGKASLETLAIILYRGGATRSDIDWVRGVNSTAALRSLLMRGLIERGEDTLDRRRARYTATVDALAHLGVAKMEDLPRFAEFQASFAGQEAARAAAEEDADLA
ncbi:MAG TPA: SMC-Scp complex subunit ScpB [Candidatus Paceibacterota bacterium]|jgi:segregation and condensation protein B|nr:SMC-Scp complex subunit ScpB [Candidatus Paceibacterota bacterium]